MTDSSGESLEGLEVGEERKFKREHPEAEIFVERRPTGLFRIHTAVPHQRTTHSGGSVELTLDDIRKICTVTNRGADE